MTDLLLPPCAVISLFNQSFSDVYGDVFSGYTPSQLAFIIFVSVWTLLVVAFQLIVPRFNEKIGHKFVILALDALTMLLWFAGFVALAVFTGAATGSTLPNWYRTLQACVAFAAFTWYVPAPLLSRPTARVRTRGIAHMGCDVGSRSLSPWR